MEEDLIMEDILSNNCSNSSGNASCSDGEQAPVEDYFYFVLFSIVVPTTYGLVTLVGLIGNILVIYVILRNQKMRTVTNILLLNLALADLSFVLIVPGVTNQMTAPMNDLGLALTTTVALVAWWKAVILEENRRWFVVAGIAAGGALGTKYLALLFAVAMAVGCAWVAWRRDCSDHP